MCREAGIQIMEGFFLSPQKKHGTNKITIKKSHKKKTQHEINSLKGREKNGGWEKKEGRKRGERGKKAE